MPEVLVLVADRARGRFLRLQHPEEPLQESGPHLIELEDLVEPEGQLKGKEQFSNLKSGRNRVPTDGPAHGFDDHRDSHRDEVEKRFAQRLTQALARWVQEMEGAQVILLAAPNLLGALRQELERLSQRDSVVVEFAENLSRLTIPQIERALANKGLIPEAVRPPSASASRSRRRA